TAADELTELLGLPGQDHRKRTARRDKARMIAELAAAGIPHARTATVTSRDELIKVLDEWDSYPVVIKPPTSAGTDGCAVCTDRDRALAAFAATAGARNLMGQTNHEILVQEWLNGRQYIVNTVSQAGRHLLTELYAERIDRIAGVPVLRH